MHKIVDLSQMSFGADGRVELNSKQLAEIEASYVPSAGGGPTNDTNCTNTSNNGCTNSGSCGHTSNQATCTNDYVCHGASNQSNCKGVTIIP